MQHMFRVTYVATSYMEIEFAADDRREAEMLFEAAASYLGRQGQAVGKPQWRIVDIAALDEPPLGIAAPADRVPA